MAERPASDKTEQPTPERLQKAREEGRIPESQEMPSALVVGAFMILLALATPALCGWLVNAFRQGLSLPVKGAPGSGVVIQAMQSSLWETMGRITPFLLGAAAASFVGSFLVGGWTFAPKALEWKLDRLNPSTGMQNLMSAKSAVHLLIAIVKLCVLLAIVWSYMKDKLPTLLMLEWAPLETTVVEISRLVLGAGSRIAVGLLGIAAADLLYQRWSFHRQMMMTRQEVKEERRQHELSPEVRGRIRSIQIAMAHRRMLQDVPKADAVIVNPTHVAVAIRYDHATMNAPVVLAKGADFLCQKIKEIAAEHNVPVVEKPELARSLYAAVDVGEAVPESLFVAVAEVLAVIYRLRGRRRNLLR